jgi:nicotinate-nucleotide pyrophosphorylase (carboxylating)
MTRLDPSAVSGIVSRAIAEDLGAGDITTRAVIPENEEASAEITAKEPLVVAGLPVAAAVFAQLDGRVAFKALVGEGVEVAEGAAVAALSGPAAPILVGERTALNFLQHLSGIATLTRRFVELVKGTPATIVDTRKTIPGLRHLEKYAVAAGGGTNHRMGLHDRILIKGNHILIQGRYSADGIARAVALARERAPGAPVEVEADSLDDVEAAVRAGADCILLDNMTVGEIREAVRIIDGRAAAEASGGVTIETVREIALAGVQFISVGALTHSARAADMHLTILA